MKPFVLTTVTALLFVGCTALPNALPSALDKMGDSKQPQNTMTEQSSKDLGIEVCPDKVHICQGTEECCQKEGGKWDCCPKTGVPISECCYQFLYKWVCCNDTAPKCRYFLGCHWS